MSSVSSLTKKSIRPHRKSRSGCSNCKRRKVKCDEEKPCSSCISFGLACDLAPGSVCSGNGSAPVTRRGRGRPRKIWDDSFSRGTPSSLSKTTATPEPPVDVDVNPAPINLDHAELITHFITSTAATMPGTHIFWTCNSPYIGLHHPFVLHFLLAASSFHISYLTSRNVDTADEPVLLPPRQTPTAYLLLGQQHLTAGVSSFSSQLSHLNPSNCGALYLGAMLTSICTFAAGPTSPDDLLVCTVATESDTTTPSSDPTAPEPSSWTWMPFVHGVRLMHERFSPDVLFAGPMAPLMGQGGVRARLDKPVCVRDGFERVEWEGALGGLGGFLAARAPKGIEVGAEAVAAEEAEEMNATESGSGSSSAAAVALIALDNLIGIYAATYGRRAEDKSIRYDGPPDNQFVFGWLYRLDVEFVAGVRRCEPCALLVLAYYAVLLNGEVNGGAWYIEGWREHIVARVGELLAGDDECGEWLRWPAEQVGLSGERKV